MVKIVLSFEKEVKGILKSLFLKKGNFEVINTNKRPRKIPNPSPKSKFCLNYKPDFLC